MKWLKRIWQLWLAWRLRKQLEGDTRRVASREADIGRVAKLLDLGEKAKVSLIAAERKQKPEMVAYYRGQLDLLAEVLEEARDARP